MRKRKHFIFCVFWFCFITTSFAGDYLKLVLAGGDTIYVPAGCVDSLFADSKGKHVYLKIAKEDLDQAVYCNNIDKFKIVLPQTINIASGINCNLYYANLHNDRFKIPNSLVFEGIGTNSDKYWSYTPLETDIDAIITINNTLENETTSRNVHVLNSKNRSGKLSILTIGDSYADIGTFQDVFLNELKNSGYEVTAIGRKNKANGGNNENISGGSIEDFCENNQAVKFTVKGVTTIPKGYWPVYSDGTNQWAIYFTDVDSNGDGYMEAKLYSGSYTTKITTGGILTFSNVAGSGQEVITFTACEDWSLNPFWNLITNQLDFKNYIATYGFADPNVMVVQFLLNDINQYSTDSNMNSVINNIKKFVEQFHSQYPDAIIIYSLEPIGCLYWKKNSINYDLAYYNRFNFIRRFLNEFENNQNYNYLQIAPGYAWVDREDGYNLLETGNSGSNIFLNGDYSNYYSTDPVHCNVHGMNQLGDCIYSTILSSLSSKVITSSGLKEESVKKVVSSTYFTPTGIQIKTPNKGVYIKRNEYDDGSTTIYKGIK